MSHFSSLHYHQGFMYSIRNFHYWELSHLTKQRAGQVKELWPWVNRRAHLSVCAIIKSSSDRCHVYHMTPLLHRDNSIYISTYLILTDLPHPWLIADLWLMSASQNSISSAFSCNQQISKCLILKTLIHRLISRDRNSDMRYWTCISVPSFSCNTYN